MSKLEKISIYSSQRISRLYDCVRGGKNTAVFGMEWGDRTIAVAGLDRLVYVCVDYVAARETFRQLSSIRSDVVYLPSKDDVLTFVRSRSNETAFARLKALHGIVSGQAGIVVTSVEAIMQLFPSRKEFLDNCISLECGSDYAPEILVQCLVSAGYKRETQVSDSGQFARRGDILDISPINLETGVRLEFFGDTLESIKTIDFATQGSHGKMESLQIAPCSEFFGGKKYGDILAKMRSDVPSGLDTEAAHRMNSILSEIEFRLGEGLTDTTMSYLLPYAGGSTLWEFLDGKYVVVLDEVKKLNLRMIYGEHCNRFKQLLSRGEVLHGSLSQVIENPFDTSVVEPKDTQNTDIFSQKDTLDTSITQLGRIFGKEAQQNQESLFGVDSAKSKKNLRTSEGKISKNSHGTVATQTTANRLCTEIPTLLGFYKNPVAVDIFLPQIDFSFASMPLPNYTKDREALVSDIGLWSRKGMRILVFCGSADLRERLSQTLRDAMLSFGYSVDSNICLLDSELYKGAVLFDENVVLIGTYDLIAKKAKKTIKRSRKDVFSQPQIGEFVVHEVHGIGVCESVEKLTSGGSSRDYLVIRYKDGDKLFVPVENMDSLTKYNSGEENPHLSKLGGAEFSRAKERVRQSVGKMAFDLLKLYAERSMEKGVVYPPFSKEMDEFSADFPYVETDDQLTAIADGLSDLAGGKIMDRLLCGDVGYGKTEVALRLAYNVILAGKQVAFISPTTILARQHHQTVRERMEKFGVTCVSLTRLNTSSQENEAIAALKLGKADIVCGTHRVLGKDVRFSDLGLLILDEEQRFGVADKEKIKLLKKNVCVLSLSATPIPRTLHMSMAGIRDISILDTPPTERIPVQTYVTEYTDSLLIDAVGREINRGGQVFVVYNRVSSIDSFAARVAGLTGAEISVIHGQMPQKQMEDTLQKFVSGESQILVASTIIENGIDMPRANTMLVIDADRLGLSQLYQLRGRVGRSNRLAYVFFTYDQSKMLTESAYKRLESINEFTEFGSGFKIAMRDLQIRGAGNIMGREQHGHMERVGYDMYLKILSEELDKLKGAEVKPHSEVKVNIDFDAFIPTSYIQDSEWRLKVYSRISHIEAPNEIDRLESELRDIYGPVPPSVLGLCRVALIKNLAAKVGAASVTLKRGENSLNYKKVIDIPSKVVDKINAGKSRCSLQISTNPSINFAKDHDAMLAFLLG